MHVKDPKKIIRSLFQKYITTNDNVINAQKLFVVNSVIHYLFKDTYYMDVDKTKLIEYGALINRFLEEEIDIYWQNGILMVDDRYGTPRPSEV